jgi:hypothetical protein
VAFNGAPPQLLFSSFNATLDALLCKSVTFFVLYHPLKGKEIVTSAITNVVQRAYRLGKVAAKPEHLHVSGMDLVATMHSIWTRECGLNV